MLNSIRINQNSIKLEQNSELQINQEDDIFLGIDINLVQLKVVENKNLLARLPNDQTILLKDMIVHIFQNELNKEKITRLCFLLGLPSMQECYIINDMKALFDAVEFTASNLNSEHFKTESQTTEEIDVLYDGSDNRLQNTQNNDLIFYEELVKSHS